MFKPQDSSLWLWTVLVTATILASISPSVQGLICYDCDYSPGEFGRTGKGNEEYQLQQKASDGNSDTANTGNATGRRGPITCATTSPPKTRACPGQDCYYQLKPTSEGTAYYRYCALAEDHEIGCKKYPDGQVNCYCNTDLCNNKLSYGVRSSECSIATTLGLLAVLLSM